MNFKNKLKFAEELERAGKWAEAEKAYRKLLSSSDYKDIAEQALARIEEKKRIYQKVNSIYKERLGAKSYIGEDDFLCLSKDGIFIHFHIKNRDLDLEQIFRIIKRSQAKLEQALGHQAKKVTVEIMDTREELKDRTRKNEGLELRSWIGGISADLIRVNAERLRSGEPQHLAVLLTHEYAHQVISEMSKNKAPWWLSEGLAIHFSQELSSEYLEILSEAVSKNKTLDLELIAPDPSELEDESLRKLAYAQAGSVVEYLIARLGWDKIRELLTGLRKKSLSDTMARFGLNLYLLSREWQRWYKDKAK